MIESITNLMQIQNKTFTNTLNKQQAFINKFQADMDKASKEQNEKIEQVWERKDDMFALLNNKIDLMQEVIIQKIDEMMQHAEKQFNDHVSSEEDQKNFVEEIANLLYIKNA